MKTLKTAILLILAFSAGIFQNAVGESKENDNPLNDFLFYDPKPVPETKFTGPDNKESSFNDFSGQVVVLNFWATWCVPCVQEMPSLNNLAQFLKENNKNIRILTVSEDFKGLKQAQEFLEKKKLLHLEAYADQKNKLYNSFKIAGLPSTVFIDAKGREVARINGDINWNNEKVREFVLGLEGK